MPYADPKRKREQAKGYREAHRENDRARKKANYRLHSEGIKAAHKAYRATNQKKVLMWRRTHRERIIALKRIYRSAHKKEERAYRVAHREQFKAYTKAYRKAHPEKRREIDHRRRARKLAAHGSWSAKDLLVLRGILGTQCLRPDCCTPTDRVAVDHIIPLAKGGSNQPTNLQLLCLRCNARKGVQRIDYRTEEQRRKIFRAFQLPLFGAA